MKTLVKIFDQTLLWGGILSGCTLIIIMFMVTVKVFFRYVLHEGLIGIDLLSGTLLVYMTFLGAAWILQREEHVILDLLLSRVKPALCRWMNFTSSLLGAAVCLVITVFGILESVSSFQRGILIPAEIEIPRVVNLGVIPIGCFFLCCQFVRRAIYYYLASDDNISLSKNGNGR